MLVIVLQCSIAMRISRSATRILRWWDEKRGERGWRGKRYRTRGGWSGRIIGRDQWKFIPYVMPVKHRTNGFFWSGVIYKRNQQPLSQRPDFLLICELINCIVGQRFSLLVVRILILFFILMAEIGIKLFSNKIQVVGV